MSVLFISGWQAFTFLRRFELNLRNADIGRFGASGCFLARRLGSESGVGMNLALAEDSIQ